MVKFTRTFTDTHGRKGDRMPPPFVVRASSLHPQSNTLQEPCRLEARTTRPARSHVRSTVSEIILKAILPSRVECHGVCDNANDAFRRRDGPGHAEQSVGFNEQESTRDDRE